MVNYSVNDKMFWQDVGDKSKYIRRYEGNPLIDLENSEFWHVYNSAIVIKDGKYIGVFRCDDESGKPDLFMGYSKDGIKWVIEKESIVFKNRDGSLFTYPYAYDPRVAEIDGVYYIIFCADIQGPSIYIAETVDFKNFKMLPSGFLPFNRNGALFPEKISGKYIMLSRPHPCGTAYGNIWISESEDLIHWGNHKLVMKNFYLGDNYWEKVKIGAGPIPIKTKEGWILIYHGVQSTCNGLNYSVGVALLELNDPSKVLKRAGRYLLTAEKDYEKTGFTPNVCFPCSALCNSKGQVTIYYGVADTNMAIAFTTVDKLLEFVDKYNR